MSSDGGRGAAAALAAMLLAAALAGVGCGVGVTRRLSSSDDARSTSDAADPDTHDAAAADAHDDAADAAGAETDGGDANREVVPRVCSPSQRFGTPTLVPGLNDASGSVVSARFSPDELTAYLSLFHGAQEDVYVATRSSRADAFGGAAPIAEVNTLTTDECPTVTADGLTLYIDSTRSGFYDMFVATRSSPTDKFSMPTELLDLHVYGEGNPYVTPDGGALYFHSYRNYNFDIYRARRTATGFDPPESLSINTAGTESVPVVSPDEKTIYFYRDGDIPGPKGIWMATRESATDPFGMPVSLAELEVPYPPASPTWISPDGCRLYFQEVDPQYGFGIYVAERLP